MPKKLLFHLELPDNIKANAPTSALGRLLAPTHASLEHPHPSVRDLHWTSRSHRKRRYRLLGEAEERRETVWAKIARIGKLEWKELSWWIAIVGF